MIKTTARTALEGWVGAIGCIGTQSGLGGGAVLCSCSIFTTNSLPQYSHLITFVLFSGIVSVAPQLGHLISSSLTRFPNEVPSSLAVKQCFLQLRDILCIGRVHILDQFNPHCHRGCLIILYL